jgi:hypothetical protein
VKIKLAQWSLKTIHNAKDRIDPKPQFQRGEVWSLHRQQLLIDSVLRGFDVPKIYLSETKNNPHHDFEVADGQQRLRAFWAFFEDVYPLGTQSSDVKGVDLSGLRYTELPKRAKGTIDRYKLIIARLVDAPPDELRTLFARLQMGVVLTPPELRNAIASAIGSMINTVAETHNFFLGADISDRRFKRQDFLAHAIALGHYNNEADLKAKLLRTLYEEFPTHYDKAIARRTTQVLDWLSKINVAASRQIRTKWGFVDLFWLFWRHIEVIASVNVPSFAGAYVKFETTRQTHGYEPEALLGTRDGPLFDYIQAFNASGALTDRIASRQKVIEKYFLKFIKRRTRT